MLNSCHALASDSPVVKKRWPQAYTGQNSAADGPAPLRNECIT